MKRVIILYKKFIYKLIFLINLFLLILIQQSCKPKVNTGLLVPGRDLSVNIHLQYGEKVNYNEGDILIEKWSPVLQEENDSLCIYSHPLAYRSKENGLFLKVCSEFFTNFNEMLVEGFKFSDESPVLRIDGKIEFRIITLSRLVEEWKDSQPSLLIIGDRFLAESYEKENLSAEYPFYLYGSQKNIHSNYSLPYFTIISDNDSFNIYYPEIYKEGRKDSIKYAYLKIKKRIITGLNIDTFHEIIHSKNNYFLNNCKYDKISISEVSPLSSSKLKKYIELINNFKDSLCINEINILINNNNYTLRNNSGFLLPGEVVLFAEEESKLHSTQFQEFNWRDLRISSEFTIKINEEYESIFKNQNISSTKFEDGEISIQNLGLSCGNLLDLFSDSTLCMDPGVYLPVQRKFCEIENFELSEINPVGLQNKLDGKYLEIEYTSEAKCDISGLELVIDEVIVPLAIKTKYIDSGGMLVIGDKKYFSNINLIPRNLEDLKISSTLYLKKGQSKSLLFTPFKKESEYILKSSDEKTYSLLKIGRDFYIHPLIPKFGFVSPWGDFHAGSPGEKTYIQNNPGSATFSELNQYGSYSSLESYPGDKFLEIELSPGTDYRLVEKVSNIVVKTYFIPPIEKSTTFILAETNLFCFPKQEVFLIENFPNLNTLSTLEIFSGDTLLDKIFIEETGFGEENRNSRFRRSSTRIINSNNWKNTYLTRPLESMNSSCFPFTHATPGKKNKYLPEVGKITREQDNIKIILNYSESQPEELYEGVLHNNFSKLDFSFLVNNRNPSIIIPSGNISQEELSYINWKLSSEVIIVQQPGLRIEGLSPHPKNPQNEWVFICNRSEKLELIQNYEIQDSIFYDKIVPYRTRFPEKNLFSFQDTKFDFSSDVLLPSQCGFLIDPDAFNPTLYNLTQNRIPIFTIKDDSSIGNGIGVDENINLHKIINNKKILVSSYGNMYSNFPFKIRVSEDEMVILKDGRVGDSPRDFRVVR